MRRPTTPEELRDQLYAIFPDFQEEWDIEDNEFIDDGRFTYHGLMLAFHDYITVRIPELSQRQVQTFAELLNTAVAQDDDLENAISTVFLEHMHQLGISKLFGTYLTAQAKRKAHA